jgi:hypothetical protein
MTAFEDPWQFTLDKNFESTSLKYFDLREFTQGGPEVGRIMINGRLIEGLFGGPALITRDFVFIPKLMTRFVGHEFCIAKIKSDDLYVAVYGKCHDLIFLDKIIDNKVIYFTNRNKTSHSYYEFL